MTNPFGQLDDTDREAMREGFAIARLRNYTTIKGSSKIDKMKNRKRIKRKKEEEVDILRILNIIQGK